MECNTTNVVKCGACATLLFKKLLNAICRMERRGHRYSEKTVNRIQGRVIYYNDHSPVDDVVVEVYQITPEDKKLKARETPVRRRRRAACVTLKDGCFCFVELPSGSYMVRAGTRSANAGMNEVYLKVNLGHRWFRPGKEITLELTPGT